MSKSFKIKTERISIQMISAYPSMPWKKNLSNWFTSISDSKIWKKGTVLIVGNSVASGLRESKMLFKKNIKVRFFPGARIQDIYY